MRGLQMIFELMGRIQRKLYHHLKPFLSMAVYWYYRTFKKRTFTFNGKVYRYFYSLHNTTFSNERAIEIPIVEGYLDSARGSRILEVGNVLSHYFPGDHQIIDKYEKGPSVINSDIVTYESNEKYDLLVSISTLEHVGWDEYARYGRENGTATVNPGFLCTALERLKNMLKSGGIIVVTMPLGFNPFLDDLIRDERLGLSELYFMKRVSKDNQWQQVEYAEVSGVKYSDPYPCANAVVIGIFRKQ